MVEIIILVLLALVLLGLVVLFYLTTMLRVHP